MDSDATTYLNVGDIIEFSTTGGATDFDDGEKYRVTAVASIKLQSFNTLEVLADLKELLTDDASK